MLELDGFRTMKAASYILLAALGLAAGLTSVEAATVAYWRFETGPANTAVLHAGADGAFDGSTPDVSGNGNSLSAWSQGGWAGYAYRSDVPSASVPQSGATNRFSVKNTGSYPTMFTSAAGSSSGINARTITPAQFTVEASCKLEANGGYRTVVGRDARNVSSANTNLAAFYLQVRPDDSACVNFTDVAGYTHEAYSPPGLIYGFNFSTNPEGTNAPWHNLVAVSDGSTLKLYVNNVLVASNDMTLSGSPDRSLAKGATSGSDWTTGAWSVGRGLYAGGHTDRAYGFIDEVRISNAALSPAKLLSAPRPRIASAAVSGGTLTLTARNGQPGATCYVLQSPNPTLPLTNWPSVAVKVFDANGSFSLTNPLSQGFPRMFYTLRAAILTPAPGALTYELAGGAESWPADIRAQIIYAMDGAVGQYNRYGSFPKHLYANYNSSVPTAQGNYSGWIDFGGSRNYRVALHEISHTLGIGTVWNWSTFMQNGQWTGANALAQLREFDGSTVILYGDSVHFWPYGLNYDNEASTENNRRHVLMVAAFRRDLGIQ
jgi:hypothetical protein